jgi:hypothetical protein
MNTLVSLWKYERQGRESKMSWIAWIVVNFQITMRVACPRTTNIAPGLRSYFASFPVGVDKQSVEPVTSLVVNRKVATTFLSQWTFPSFGFCVNQIPVSGSPVKFFGLSYVVEFGGKKRSLLYHPDFHMMR